jgi:class 3 adenylate cyclase
LDLEVRCGLHTGELELLQGDVGGFAVNLAARVVDQAKPGEVLVSRTVVDLVAGSGVGFEDRGTYSLKGIPDDWQLCAVAWGARSAGSQMRAGGPDAGAARFRSVCSSGRPARRTARP